MAQLAAGGKSRWRTGDARMDSLSTCKPRPEGGFLRALSFSPQLMNTALVQVKEPVHASADTVPHTLSPSVAIASKLRLRTLLAVPLATLAALAVHLLVCKNEAAADTHSYTGFLGILLGASFGAAAAQPFWSGLRRWMAH